MTENTENTDKPTTINLSQTFKAVGERMEKARAIFEAVNTIKETGGAVEIAGVRIEPCDEYGATETTRRADQAGEAIQRVQRLLDSDNLSKAIDNRWGALEGVNPNFDHASEAAYVVTEVVKNAIDGLGPDDKQPPAWSVVQGKNDWQFFTRSGEEHSLDRQWVDNRAQWFSWEDVRRLARRDSDGKIVLRAFPV